MHRSLKQKRPTRTGSNLTPPFAFLEQKLLLQAVQTQTQFLRATTKGLKKRAIVQEEDGTGKSTASQTVIAKIAQKACGHSR